MNLLLSPVTAVTCDAAFEVIEDAAIHIESGRITYCGPRAAAPDFAPDETLGGEHIVALPGLVNAHAHHAMTLQRGFADDKPLEAWLQEDIWPFEKNLAVADIVAGTELALVESIRGGVTTVADMYFGYETVVQTYIDSGARACPGAVLLGFLPGADEKMARGRDFVRDLRGAGNGRITPFWSPHSLYTCNREQWEKILAWAREDDVLVHTHVSETAREVHDVTRDWGASPVQTLKNIGALDGPLLAAHCVYIDDKDWDVLAQCAADPTGDRFRVAHNPTSNLKLASGFAPVQGFLKRGIPVGVATDGAASNNDLDMWEEMRLAALLAKGSTGDATAVSAREALLMATREGARCLGLPDVGTLEPGMKADIVLMDFDAAHLTPCHSVVSNLVYAAKASDVTATIADGKVLYQGGEWKTMDEARIKSTARTAAQRLASAARA